MSGSEQLEEMGPIDYILVEWPERQPNGEVAPHLIDLVDRGLIRVLDLVFIAKDEDGTIRGLEIADVGGEVTEPPSSRAPPPGCSPTRMSRRREA